MLASNIEACAQISAFCQATYQALADPDSHFEDWGLVVAGGRELAPDTLRRLCRSATNTSSDVVYLEFGNQIQRGPQRVQIIAPGSSECLVFHDCAFWAEDDHQSLKLVRRDGGPGHFSAGGGELIHLPWPVSPMPQPGLRRARHRLRRIARDCAGAVEGSFLASFAPGETRR